jgi:chromosome segregation ATPase
VELTTLLPAAGGFGVLAFVIGLLLKSNRDDRADYRAAIEAERREADAARSERNLAEQRLDEARAARRKAEDDLARSVRAAEKAAEQIAALTQHVASLEGEVRRLTDMLVGRSIIVPPSHPEAGHG